MAREASEGESLGGMPGLGRMEEVGGGRAGAAAAGATFAERMGGGEDAAVSIAENDAQGSFAAPCRTLRAATCDSFSRAEENLFAAAALL